MYVYIVYPLSDLKKMHIEYHMHVNPYYVGVSVHKGV